MFSPNQKDFGVIKIDKDVIKVFETQSRYSNLNVGQEIKDARWSGSGIVVYLMDGTIRRYTSLSQYINIY